MIGIDKEGIIMSKIIYKGGSEEEKNDESVGSVMNLPIQLVRN